MRVVLLSIVVAAATSTAALAQTYVKVGDDNARLLACFEEVVVPAKYNVKKILVTPAKQQYIKRLSGRIELVEIPAVYREERTLVSPEATELREIACN